HACPLADRPFERRRRLPDAQAPGVVWLDCRQHPGGLRHLVQPGRDARPRRIGVPVLHEQVRSASVVGIKTCTKFQLEAKVIDFFVSQRFTATNAYVRCKSHSWNFVHVLMPTTLGQQALKERNVMSIGSVSVWFVVTAFMRSF